MTNPRQLAVDLLKESDLTADELAKLLKRTAHHTRSIIRELEAEGLAHSIGLKSKSRLFRFGPDPKPEGMKVCGRCGESKPNDTEHFARHKGGMHTWCLDCKREYHREHIRRVRIGEEKSKANAEEKRQEDTSKMYDIKELAPGHRQYRLAGGYKAPRVERPRDHMTGYASGLTWIN